MRDLTPLTYLGVEISKHCSWETHTAVVVGKGTTHIGKKDAILTDSNLGTRIKKCIIMNVVVPKATTCRSSMGRAREVCKTVGNSSDDSS